MPSSGRQALAQETTKFGRCAAGSDAAEVIEPHVIPQGLAGRADDGELTGSTEWLCDVRRNHGGEFPAERELERQVRARDPGSDSFPRDDPIAEVVARPFVDERRAS